MSNTFDNDASDLGDFDANSTTEVPLIGQVENDHSVLLTSLIVKDRSYVAYDNFRLPEIRRSGFQNEGLEDYIAQVRPITEAVSVAALDEYCVLITIGSHSSVLKFDKEEYYSRKTGMVGEFSVDKLGPYTIITVGGLFIERNLQYGEDGKKLTLAFADEIHAYQFKEDLLLALTHGKTPYKVVRKPPLASPNSEAVEVYHYPKKSRGWFGFSMGLILGLTAFGIFSTMGKSHVDPNDVSYLSRGQVQESFSPDALRELEAIAASRSAAKQMIAQDIEKADFDRVVGERELPDAVIVASPLTSKPAIVEPTMKTQEATVIP